jgi:hypothetical protein
MSFWYVWNECVILCQLVALFGQIVELICQKTVWTFDTVVVSCRKLVLTFQSTALCYQTGILFCQNTVFKCPNVVLLCQTEVLISQLRLLNCLIISNIRNRVLTGLNHAKLYAILLKSGFDSLKLSLIMSKKCGILTNCGNDLPKLFLIM